MIKIKFIDKKQNKKDVVLVSLVKEQKENQVLNFPQGKKLISIGIDNPKQITLRKIFIISRQIISLAKSNKIKKIAIDFKEFTDLNLKISPKELANLLSVNFEMANFDFVQYKTPPKEGWNFVEEVFVVGKINRDVKMGFEKGLVIGREINNCRYLINTPGGEMTPKMLADKSKKAVKGTKVKVKVLNKKEMEKLKMGGILGVSRGSSEEPKFIILEYKGGKKNEKPIVLVGKAITFDTGGLNLKPGDHMQEMHMDMAGGAAVIYTLVLASKLKIKKNVVGLVPAAENMPSGSSYRPGDILKTMSGKTIEVLNTDAEGRIILADALTYAAKYKPRAIIDIATLTGAAIVALGERASVILSNNENLEKLAREMGELSGDYVWPLPLWEEYEEEIKGTFGDIINVSKKKNGGAIIGAIFLYQFVKDLSCPWLHIDIAPKMVSIEGEYLAKGASGAPVRLLIKLLEKF